MKLKGFLLLMLLGVVTAVPSVAGARFEVQDHDLDAVNDLSLDIARVAVSRMGKDHLVFSVFFNGDPDPAHFRLMMDVDGLEGGDPSTGADYMVEGEQLFKHSGGGGLSFLLVRDGLLDKSVTECLRSIPRGGRQCFE